VFVDYNKNCKIVTVKVKETVKIKVKVKVKQSIYRPGETLKFP
jgi:hypothetical protein